MHFDDGVVCRGWGERGARANECDARSNTHPPTRSREDFSAGAILTLFHNHSILKSSPRTPVVQALPIISIHDVTDYAATRNLT